MPHDGQTLSQGPVLADLLKLTEDALPQVEHLFVAARESLRVQVTVGGKISAAAMEEHQFAAHTLAWLATYTESLRQMQAWASRTTRDGTFGEMEALILQIAFGEYLSQIHGGIPMSQGEIARVQDARQMMPDEHVKQAARHHPGKARFHRAADRFQHRDQTHNAKRQHQRRERVHIFHAVIDGARIHKNP